MLARLGKFGVNLLEFLKLIAIAFCGRLKAVYTSLSTHGDAKIIITIIAILILVIAIGFYRICGVDACDVTQISINGLLLWPFDIINNLFNRIGSTLWPSDNGCQIPSPLSDHLPKELIKDKDLVDTVSCKMEIWRSLASGYNKSYLTLSYASIFLSTLVAAAASLLPGKERAKACVAWSAAIVAGLLSLLQPADTYHRFDEAWLVLDMRWNEYRLQLDHVNREALWAAVAEGESIIHQGSKVTEVLKHAEPTALLPNPEALQPVH